MKESYFVGNEAAKKYGCYRERIDTPLMRKVLDREHDVPDDALSKRVDKGLVPGGNWSQTTTERKPLVEIRTHLGPGDYDVTIFDRSAQGSRSRSIKFSDCPSDRMNLEYEDAPSATSYSPNFEAVLPRSSHGVIPFNSVPRFNNPYYRKPGYAQTSGLILSHDYDRKKGWRSLKFM